MIALTNYLTFAGAASISKALATLLKDAWPRAPEPWVTWGIAKGIVFLGGILQGPLTAKEILLLCVSGTVVGARAVECQKENKRHFSNSRSRHARWH